MNEMKRGLVAIMVIFVFAFAKAQEGTNKTSPRAEKKYDKFAFIESRAIYERLADKGFKSVEIFSKLGDTYYFNNDYPNALKWYEELFQLDNNDIPAPYYFRYAQALKSDKQYAKADIILKRFSRTGNRDSRVDAFVKNPDYLTEVDFQQGRFEVQPAEVNSKYMDFGTAYYGLKQVVFASTRDTGTVAKRRHSWNNQPFLDLYVADRNEEGALSNVQKFDSRINSILHESTPTFTADMNTVYFTRNNIQNGRTRKGSGRITRLKIFKSEKIDGEWSEPLMVAFSDGDFSTAHPALTPDGKTLYFSSDMPGTMGEKAMIKETDIWRVSILEDGTYGDPENVSIVNTEGRESYPYISQSGNLYFASNGLQGLGGLDIFVATINKDGSLSKPVNIGKPANSADDDFAFVIDDNVKLGYFSSNRENEEADDNIYRFVQLEDLREKCEQIVSGTVTDSYTKDVLANSRVSVIDENNNVVVSQTSNSNGNYAFNLECDKTYFIRAEKQKYNTAEELVTTPSKTSSIKINLALDPIGLPAKPGDDLAKILNLNPIYFDFDMSFIREDAEIELQKVLAVLEDYPTMVIDIRSHTDSRGSKKYNERLSSRRAASTRNYLISKGVDPSRLTSKGYGESELVNDCSDGVPCTEEQHQKNRRSEFIIISM